MSWPARPQLTGTPLAKQHDLAAAIASSHFASRWSVTTSTSQSAAVRTFLSSCVAPSGVQAFFGLPFCPPTQPASSADASQPLAVSNVRAEAAAIEPAASLLYTLGHFGLQSSTYVKQVDLIQ
jgi:hypothetical protein